MVFAMPPEDEVMRHVCNSCGYIHYDNPRVLVLSMMTWQDKLLMMRRALEPGAGKWSVPGGFLEISETPREGAARELREEVGVLYPADQLSIYMVGFVVPMNQVYLIYRGALDSDYYDLGSEATEARFFDQSDFPWQELAFSVLPEMMDSFYSELASGSYGVYQAEYHGEDNHVYSRVE